MAKDKKGFILYADQIDLFEELPDDKAGQLIKHIFNYVNDKNPETSDLIIKVAFSPIKTQLKRDLVKYNNICERNKINGAKGGRPKKPSGLIGNPKKPKKADIDNDIDKGRDNDKVKVNDIKDRDTEILLFFHNTCIDLPKVLKLTEQRKKSIEARIEEYDHKTLGKVFKMTNESDFLSGRTDKFKASFDWILKKSNFIKILEGNYKNINNKNEQRTEKLKQLAKITAENFGEER